MEQQTAIEEFIKENEDLVKYITAVAVEKAVPEAISAYEKRKAAVSKEEGRKRIANTKKILKRYKELKLYADKLDDEIKSSISIDMPLDEKEKLIKMLEFSDDIVSTIKESTQKTIVMLQHIETGMETLEIIYKKENNERYFNIVKDLRIVALKKDAVAEKYNMHPRSVEKIEDKVAERLAVLLFGIYGIRLE